MAQLTWHDDATVDSSTLPSKSADVFLEYGFVTMLRNAGAKAVSDVRKALVAGTNKKVSEVTTAEIKSYRDSHQEQYDVWASAYMSQFRTAVMAGEIELPSSTAGLSQDELDRRQAAVKTIDDAMASKGKKFPWPRAERNSGDAGAEKAAAAREQIITDFFARCVPGGKMEKYQRPFARNLAAIKKARELAAQPEGSLADLEDLAAE